MRAPQKSAPCLPEGGVPNQSLAKKSLEEGEGKKKRKNSTSTTEKRKVRKKMKRRKKKENSQTSLTSRIKNS